MNQYNPEFTKKIMKDMLDKFEYIPVLRPYDADFKEQVTIDLPWYLSPFRQTIERIAFNAFLDGKLNLKKGDTITIKRPRDYVRNAE